MPIKSSPTCSYSQPKFYRFSSDSIHLAKRACSFLRNHDCGEITLIDGFCGCGVVGLEILSCQLNCKIKETYFIEKNKKFKKHLEENMGMDSSQTNKIIFWKDFFELKKSDFNISSPGILIVLNPPYFKQND